MKLKNSLSNELIEFDDNLTIYLCGPTVYDYPHIGNMRPIIFFDILNRILRFENKKINFAHNITDIDDKIIDKAIQENKTEQEIANYYEQEYLKNLNQLNILFPTYLPKVTDNIQNIIDFIDKLVSKNFAYEKNGSVYFEVEKYKNYFNLANLKLENLKNNQEFSDEKRNQLDFALWKKTTKGITFDSKWGKGRPGWHTECSAMIQNIFGSNGIDIHGGGIDLKFPHHINEIAQYSSLTNNNLAKCWIHVGHVNLDEKKMSKSVGNIFKVNDFLDKYSANILKILLTQISYSKPINVSSDSINNAKKTIEKIKNIILKYILDKDFKLSYLDKSNDKDFVEILNNNLNTVEAISYLFKLLKNIEETKDLSSFQKLLFNLELIGIQVSINTNNLLNYHKFYKEKKYKDSDPLRNKILTI